MTLVEGDPVKKLLALVSVAAVAVAAFVFFRARSDDAADVAAPAGRVKTAETQSDGETGGEFRGEEEGERGDDEDRIQRLGTASRTGPLELAPAPGWAGEHIFGNGNDWEPAVAADPSAPFVYMITTRYSGQGPLPCPVCDIPAITLKVSSDGGQTFGGPIFMPVDVTGGQYDPQIATDDAGDVFAVWINGNFRDVISRSVDHGVTWSDPVVISGPAGWADHPWLGVSPNGQHVYVGFNHAAEWVAQSHDGGVTWEDAVQTSGDARYFYENGTVVHDDGTVAISAMSYRLGSGPPGKIKLTVTRSTDGGATFQMTTVDRVGQQPDCTNKGCPVDHYGAQAALAGDANGRLLVVYDGALHNYGAQYIWVRHSDDNGVTWSDRKRVSPLGPAIIASFSAATGRGAGDFRIAWQDDRNGYHRWNTFVRTSSDGGVHWSPEVDVSDANGGRGYKFAKGYKADYGDYMEVAITDTGKTFAVWGEGFSYYGPGGTWYNVET
jgi:hypothetical protein